MIPTYDRDDEEHPRNAAAIRTAIMLGAEFFEDVGGQWQVKGVDMRSHNKTMPAWMFLATHGLGIDKNGTPRKFKDIPPELPSRFETFRRAGEILSQDKEQLDAYEQEGLRGDCKGVR